MAAVWTGLAALAGQRVATPNGPEEILEIDLTRDQVRTERTGWIDAGDLVASQPPEQAGPEERAEWLDGPDWVMVSARPVDCSCECSRNRNRGLGGGGCYWLVTTHSESVVHSHQRDAACRCHVDASCCVYPLGS